MDAANLLRPRKTSLLQRQKSVLGSIQATLDVFVSIALLFALALAREGTIDFLYRLQAVIVVLLMLSFYSYFGVYRFQTDPIRMVIRLTKAWASVVFCLFLVGFITQSSTHASRQIILIWIGGSYVLQLSAHTIFRLLVHKYHRHQRRGLGHQNVLIIGASVLGHYLARRINDNPWLHTTVVGVVDDSPLALSRWSIPGIPLLGGFSQLGELIRNLRVVSVYIALPLEQSNAVAKIYAELEKKNVNIYWAPDIHGLKLVNPSVKELGGVPLLTLSETPLLGTHKWLKSLEDNILATLILLVLSPIMALIALLIKLDSPGPIIFKQQRHGWDGRLIEVWKFRTMYVRQGESPQVKQATRDDPRITRVGKFLRRTSIDELPQLFNVLQGSMSLVGPRPHAVEHNDYYSKRIDAYLSRHRIKPGMTGLAQVEGFRGETETLDKMEGRVAYDLKYINEWSVWLDLWILFKTAFTVFSKNAY
ncbi:MAG: undecaprenyl-phosphate glucose phosphotransferase [Gammaproteobacteria bacterium]